MPAPGTGALVKSGQVAKHRDEQGLLSGQIARSGAIFVTPDLRQQATEGTSHGFWIQNPQSVL
jgi:hypothetical protein